MQITTARHARCALAYVTDKTCAKEVIVMVSDKETITTTFPKSGQLTYACATNMITGVVNVQ